MAKNNNQAGEDFQNFILESHKLTSKLLSLDEDEQLIDIDSKKGFGKEIRTNLKDIFKQKYGGYTNESSSLRGDFYLQDINAIQKKKIIDAKNYLDIQSNMYFHSSQDVKKFMKGFDSNIKYLLGHKLHLFNFDDDVLYRLKDFIFSKNSKQNIEWVNSLKHIYNEETKIGSISKEGFNDIFLFMELGFAWNEFDVAPEKYFISKNKDNEVIFSCINFNNSLNNDDFIIKFCVSQKGYFYIYFYQGDDCVYILSQRDDWTANCSFINKDYMQVVNKVQIPN
jgi:hypothetical protein